MLEVRNVSVTYGRHRALDGTSVSVGKGEICVILGANGAGKSTLLKTIAGLVHTAPGGEIVMNGKLIAGMKPHRIVEEGIALVPEGRGIFGDLTVAENLQLGAFARRARNHEAETLRRIYELFPRLEERRKQIARTMSGGEQQMVAIGRALMSKPEILMLDEPSLGLSPLLTQELFRSLKAVAQTGVGILLVEQNAKQSLKIAGRGYLLENGHVTGENSASALMNDPAVVNAYLGGTTKGARQQPTITLPASMRLPASVEAMGRALGDFATRAGRIQQAFVRAMRRDGPVPSAFVGRYDPKSAGDPWQQAADESCAAALSMISSGIASVPVISTDARRLSGNAATLAQRAGERLAGQIRMRRLSSPRPSGFAPDYASGVPAVPQWHGAPTGLVAHGGDTAHAARGAENSVNGIHGLIGHNSAGVEDEVPEAAPDAPSPADGLSIADLATRAAAIHARHIAERRASLPVSPGAAIAGVPTKTFEPTGVRDAVKEAVPGSIADLVARAASIQSSHVAAGRKRLASFTIPAAPSAGHHKNQTAPAKRKKHKET